jgi:hypothetical protein
LFEEGISWCCLVRYDVTQAITLEHQWASTDNYIRRQIKDFMVVNQLLFFVGGCFLVVDGVGWVVFWGLDEMLPNSFYVARASNPYMQIFVLLYCK